MLCVENKFINAIKNNKVVVYIVNKIKYKKYKPIVFVNKPINNSKADVIGLNSQVEAIQDAIKNDANIIGILADYGTGKSTITDMLVKKLESGVLKFPGVIRVNMWDTLKKQSSEDSIKNEVSELSKSFLFQIANGKSDKFASYVNKRLSKNYGNITVATSSCRIWWFLFLSAFTWGIYKILQLKELYFLDKFNSEILTQTISVIRDFSPMLLVVAGVFIFFAIKDTTVIFSHWKNNNKQEPEVNDLFDVYSVVIRKLRPYFYKTTKFLGRKRKRVIIIEDLDRIVDKTIIIAFLKELYRFQSSLKRYNDRYVFIISLKPETMLDINEELAEKFPNDDERIYSKIFDVSFFLKPIHYADYESVMIDLLNKNKNQKSKLERLLNKKIDKSLPQSFNWILRGENLTLRDMKDRLNHAISIMVSLKNKHYKNVEDDDVNFNACTAVAYLESRFPDELYSIISCEESFEQVINESYIIKNKETQGLIHQKLEESFLRIFKAKTVISKNKTNTAEKITSITGQPVDGDKQLELDSQFVKEFCSLIIDGTFDNDFRMYFYNYPDRSYIKSSDEKDIYNLIRLPGIHYDYSNLDEKVDRIFEKRKNTIIINTIESLDTKTAFPKVLLLNDKLFEIATNYSYTASLNTLCDVVLKKTIDGDIEGIFNRINRVDFNDKEKYIKEFSEKMCKFFISQSIDEKTIYTYREKVIKCFNNYIPLFKTLFINAENSNVLPLISRSETEILSDISTILDFSDIRLIDENVDYLHNKFTERRLPDEDYQKATIYYDRLKEVCSHESIYNLLLDFVSVNNAIDDTYFEIIMKHSNDEDKLCKYLNHLNFSDFTETYWILIDQKGFKSGLSQHILEGLYERDLVITYVLSLAESNKLENVKFGNSEVANLLCNAAKSICEKNENLFLRMRKAIIVELQDVSKLYINLFDNEFPLVTKDELNLFEDFSDAIICIDGRNISVENCNYILEYCNQSSRNDTECKRLFDFLFNKEKYPETVSDSEIIKKLFDGFDFTNIAFKNLKDEDKEVCISFVGDAIGLSKPENCLASMKHLHTVIPSLEKLVQGDLKLYEEYIDFINNEQVYSKGTVDWLSKVSIQQPLIPELTKQLKSVGAYKNYVIGKSLYDGKLCYEPSVIPVDTYLDIYLSCEKLFEMLSKDKRFIGKVVKEELYDKIKTSKHAMSLSHVANTFSVFNHSFSLITEASKRQQYILNIPKIKTEKDSIEIQKYLCEEDVMKDIGRRDIKDKILILLWESNPEHKQEFSSAWNETHGKKEEFDVTTD